jgi:hypothetical protein
MDGVGRALVQLLTGIKAAMTAAAMKPWFRTTRERPKNARLFRTCPCNGDDRVSGFAGAIR